MKLMVKQEIFCNTYQETGNATEAYRQAYDCGNMKYDTIVKRAGEMLHEGGRIFSIGVRKDVKAKMAKCEIQAKPTMANKETRILMKSGWIKKLGQRPE